MNIVLDGDPDPPQREEGELGKIWPIVNSLHISRLAEARGVTFGLLIDNSGP